MPIALVSPATTRKRAVNLTLNEKLVVQARALTENLSETVEGLLRQYVTQERNTASRLHDQADRCSADWNALHERIGSFADQHVRL